ncbi:MAG: ADP-ribosylglycohydrolase family protein [Clostridiales bacterium]|nr:ADP-ribosylglycohydrolase family protein [Clostridiales bacterium]
MYGAILGDIIGSPFEFDQGKKTKDFDLFSKGARFTDDSVMTIAVAEALLDAGKDASADRIRELVTESMRKWGRRYPHAGYGGSFRVWLWQKTPVPYGSYGNGSAMRVSAAGWLYDTLERTEAVARATAEVTHNHPEGIKGAESVAGIIFLARTGSSKEEIRTYVTERFGYDLSRTCDEIRPQYHHMESCQQTVPEAITAFLEGNDFEDVIRTAVSLGGDCDTLTAIAGSMAEAFYGIPALLTAECRDRIPEDMLTVLNRFDETLGRGREAEETSAGLKDNRYLEKAISIFYGAATKENLVQILAVISRRMEQQGQLIAAVEPSQAVLDLFDPARLKVGDTVTAQEDLRFRLRKIRTEDGREWFAVFTREEEVRKGQDTSTITISIENYLKAVLDMEDAAGVVINPWGQRLFLYKELIRVFFEQKEEK